MLHLVPHDPITSLSSLNQGAGRNGCQPELALKNNPPLPRRAGWVTGTCNESFQIENLMLGMNHELLPLHAESAPAAAAASTAAAAAAAATAAAAIEEMMP